MSVSDYIILLVVLICVGVSLFFTIRGRKNKCGSCSYCEKCGNKCKR